MSGHRRSGGKAITRAVPIVAPSATKQLIADAISKRRSRVQRWLSSNVWAWRWTDIFTQPLPRRLPSATGHNASKPRQSPRECFAPTSASNACSSQQFRSRVSVRIQQPEPFRRVDHHTVKGIAMFWQCNHASECGHGQSSPARLTTPTALR